MARAQWINDAGSEEEIKEREKSSVLKCHLAQPNGSSQQSLVALMVACFSDNHSKSVRTADDKLTSNALSQAQNTDSRNPCQRKTLDKDCGCLMATDKAEREGFEPSEPLRVHRFSRPARSATLSPLRVCQCLWRDNCAPA